MIAEFLRYGLRHFSVDFELVFEKKLENKSVGLFCLD